MLLRFHDIQLYEVCSYDGFKNSLLFLVTNVLEKCYDAVLLSRYEYEDWFHSSQVFSIEKSS